jgi:Secretion system C-terminal sorting domain
MEALKSKSFAILFFGKIQNTNNYKKLPFLLFLIFSVNLYSQQVTKILISGLPGFTEHDTDVKEAFLKGYASYDSTQFPGQIDLHIDNWPYNALEHADSIGYQIVVRSYTGLSSTVDDSAKQHPKVLLFMPAGSNSFYDVCNLNISHAAVVSTGAGLDTLVTGYKVEFFSIDPITSSNESSFSNGYIAGQIAFLANHFNITPQQARIYARYNSSVQHQSTNYVKYGKINLQAAVQSYDSSSSSLPIELVSFTGSTNDGTIRLSWNTAEEINNYGFDIERGTETADGSPENNWNKIGFVRGNGNSNSPQSYSFVDNNPMPGEIEYRLKEINNNGTFKYSNTISLNFNKPLSFKLYQNYPNPFNPTTVISYQLPVSSHVTLKVYNVLGRKVAVLVNGNKQAGNHKVTFDASRLSSGVYFYRIREDNFVAAKKLIVTK